MRIRDYIDYTPCKNSKYTELLSKLEWKIKRYEILNRDKFQCQECGFVSIPQIEDVEQYDLFTREDKKYCIKYIPYPSANIQLKSIERGKYIARKDVEFIEFHQHVIMIYNGFYCLTKWKNMKEVDIAFPERGSCTLNIYHYEVDKYRESVYITPGYSQHNALIEQPIKIEKEFTRGHKLHIHHKYYISGACPWEYHNNALITLCSRCHHKIHSQGYMVPIFANIDKEHYFDDYTDVKVESNTKIRILECCRCHGKKIFDEYLYIEDGVCYECHGLGFIIKDIESGRIYNEEIPMPSKRKQNNSDQPFEESFIETEMPF